MLAGNDLPKIHGYTLKSILGVGGFATVYLAHQQGLQRDVALKIIDPRLAKEPGYRDRFIREARNMASVCNHPNITTVFDIGQTQNHDYISLQYLPGNNLEQLLRNKVSIPQPITIALRIAAALEYMHLKGYVHRDIKPSNILFNDADEALLSDFGIAKANDHSTQLTQVGTLLGTARYMSPEQASGNIDTDRRSDLYSLGIVLFEMLVNEPPFQSNNPLALINQHLNDPPPDLPESLQWAQPVIKKLLAKNPDHRYATANDLIDDLKKLQHLQATHTTHITAIYNTADSKLMPLAIGSLLILVVVLWFLNHQSKHFLNRSDCTSLSDKQMIDRDRLLNIADLHESVGRIESPPGANAVAAYRKALHIDPCNHHAAKALERLSKL